MTLISFLAYYISSGLFLVLFYFLIQHKGIDNWIKSSIEKEKSKKFKLVTTLKNTNGIDEYIKSFVFVSMIFPIIPLIFIVGDLSD